MKTKWKILLVVLPLLLLMAGCSLIAREHSPTQADNQGTADSNPGGVPIVLPTHTIPEPANINPGKIIGTVYISDQDHNFHRADCSRLGISNTPINRQAAIIQGYGACSTCNP
jgi:hypothetical protein